MTSKAAFVWVYLPGDVQPTLCGRFSHELTAAGLGVGQFVYGRSYLANAQALPLDPFVLPLVDRHWDTTAQRGLFGVIDDACPDDWGRYVVDRQHGKQSSPVDYLLKSQQDRVGALAFSAGTSEAPVQVAPMDQAWLPSIRRVIADLEQDRPIPPELALQIRPNTGLGGARPKLTVIADDCQWLAKFPALQDRPAVPMARLEAASLDLAERCGIHTVTRRVVHIEGADILLVKRFDRTQRGEGWTHDGFVSARTVFASDPAANAYSFFGSYPRLAVDMARWSTRPAADRLELFRRMVFNIVIGNGDDHDRNHGFLADETRAGYRLSPAYDIVPSLQQPIHRVRQQALGVGDAGADGTVDNILSGARSFGVEDDTALEMIKDIGEKAADLWGSCCRDQGFDASAIAALADCVRPVPRAQAGPRGFS